MKRIIAIILILCSSIGLCACDNSSRSNETESSSLTLTNDIIKDLLNVKITHYWEDDDKFAKVEIYPIQPGDFSSTKVSLKLVGGEGFWLKDIDGEKFEELKWNEYTVDLLLPVNGSYEFTVELVRGEIEEYAFQNVTGTFIPR